MGNFKSKVQPVLDVDVLKAVNDLAPAQDIGTLFKEYQNGFLTKSMLETMTVKDGVECAAVLASEMSNYFRESIASNNAPLLVLRAIETCCQYVLENGEEVACDPRLVASAATQLAYCREARLYSLQSPHATV